MQRSDPLFVCDGEMAARMAAHDWKGTPLGPADAWPESLRTAVAIMLRSAYPMLLTWGEHLAMLYNDAFIPTLGLKHPNALGAPLSVEFAEVWDHVGPMQRGVLAGGPAVWAEDLALTIERGDGPELAYFTFSYSHVPDGDGPGGVLAVLSMTTDKVVAAGRLGLLAELATAASHVQDPAQSVEVAMRTLAAAPDELRSGALYAPAEDSQPPRLVRVGAFGEVSDGLQPPLVTNADDPVLKAWREVRTVVDRSVPGEGAAPLQVIIPVRVHDESGAVLVLGPHPLRPYDADHARFVHLVADHVGQILTVAGERAREQARLEALAALDAAKSAFLSNVSHEFRTPLTLLLGPLEDVLSGRTDTLDRADLAPMYDSAHRLLRMVNGLLDVARIDAHGLRAAPQPIELTELTRDLLQPFASAADRAGVVLEVDLDDALGVVEVDPDLWERIVLNLVANAVKFTHQGSVSVRLGQDGDHLLLRVADTGVGIPASDVDLVFDRFHRVQDSGGRSIEGTGLGLSLVAEAARAMGGTVTVASEVGAGSTFEVLLPRVAGEDVAAVRWAPHVAAGVALARETGPAAATLPAPPDAQVGLDARPWILVAEDNSAMRSRLSRVLADLGHVVTAPNGRVALEILRDRQVDLVVTDVMMPELDGLGLLKEIRSDDALRSTPVVLLSARAGPEAAAGAIEAGADDYVVKPFTTGELLARCRTSLELAEYRATAAASRVRSALLAGVSHDMQTPLAVITSTLELLAEDDMPADLRRHTAARARARATQLTQLVTQFLDWSRLSMNEPLPVRVVRTDLRALAEQVASAHERVQVRGPEDGLGPARCDSQRTEQILHNLVDNAERVARSLIEIRLGVEDGHLVARVLDDGPGVSPEVLPRLFEAFGPTTGRTGNGLGLHVSREAARTQGGDLVLESTGPEGTVFALRVPQDLR